MNIIRTLIAFTLGVIIMETTTQANAAPKAATSASIYNIPLKSLMGEKSSLAPYEGKVLLIVNTASECGYTKQYKGLEAIYEEFKSQGLVVLGFPSNDFGGQEPGSAEEIKNFCERKFKVTFPMFEKNAVSGKDQQPLYAHLIAQSTIKDPVKWNFEKFLIGRDGKVITRFLSKVDPESAEMKSAISTALKAK
jgi:glutathione peroxidase